MLRYAVTFWIVGRIRPTREEPVHRLIALNSTLMRFTKISKRAICSLTGVAVTKEHASLPRQK